MADLRTVLAQLNSRISSACLAAGRQPDSATLLAVSKTQPADALRAASQQGQRHFGENYLQEALVKMDALTDLDLCWHFIGPIQSNKTRAIAERFAWVHSVDRLKIAQRLNDQRPPDLPPLNVLIEVNLDNEASKQGVTPTEVATLATAITTLPNLRLRGLMAIPSAHSQDHNRAAFEKLAMTLAALPPTMGADQLSMGMSDDFETAIACGATIVRIGTALFGARR